VAAKICSSCVRPQTMTGRNMFTDGVMTVREGITDTTIELVRVLGLIGMPARSPAPSESHWLIINL